MRVERQYLAIMNSTVSHEMRNPLNAIISSNTKQESSLEKLADIMKRLDLDPTVRTEIKEITAAFQESLKVSDSSTNLIRFNVEDILALPQLKSGKFTKSISDHNIEPSIDEITSIMKF